MTLPTILSRVQSIRFDQKEKMNKLLCLDLELIGHYSNFHSEYGLRSTTDHLTNEFIRIFFYRYDSVHHFVHERIRFSLATEKLCAFQVLSIVGCFFSSHCREAGEHLSVFE